MIPEKGWGIWPQLTKYYEIALSAWGRALLTFAMAAILHFSIVFATTEFIGSLFLDFISWHDMFKSEGILNNMLLTTDFVGCIPLEIKVNILV